MPGLSQKVDVAFQSRKFGALYGRILEDFSKSLLGDFLPVFFVHAQQFGIRIEERLAVRL